MHDVLFVSPYESVDSEKMCATRRVNPSLEARTPARVASFPCTSRELPPQSYRPTEP